MDDLILQRILEVAKMYEDAMATYDLDLLSLADAAKDDLQYLYDCDTLLDKEDI